MGFSVLLDTSFLIRLLNSNDNLHINAVDYYKYFLEKNIALKVSTISIAEYCVIGNLDELPLKSFQIVPFNLNHAKRTGEFAKIIFAENKVSLDALIPRAIIPNDSKLFAQADLDKEIRFFVTSDARSKKTFSHLKQNKVVNFEIIDISNPYNEIFGVLNLI